MCVCCCKDVEIRSNSRRVCSHPASRGVEVNLVKVGTEIITEGRRQDFLCVDERKPSLQEGKIPQAVFKLQNILSRLLDK